MLILEDIMFTRQKNAMLIAEKLEFSEYVVNFGPIFHRKSTNSESGFQIDLAFLRNDKTITVCEIKNYETPVSSSVIREFNAKLEGLNFPKKYTVQKALITASGADKSLVESDYFDHILNLQDLRG